MALNLIAIDDPHDPRLTPYRDIREKDLIGRAHQFIAEGKVVLNVLLASSHFSPASLLILNNRLPGLMPLLEKTAPTCPIFHCDQTVIDAIAGFHLHRGILAVGQRPHAPLPQAPALNAFLASMPEEALVAVLCGISNHDNMGSIFRNAAAFAADGILLDKTCCDPLYRKAIRVSVGAALKVPYCQGEEIETMLAALSQAGFSTFAMSPSAHNSLYDIARPKRTALLFGTEGEGLPPQLLQKLSTLRIPIARDFDSLNVATSSGIALSHFASPDKLR